MSVEATPFSSETLKSYTWLEDDAKSAPTEIFFTYSVPLLSTTITV